MVVRRLLHSLGYRYRIHAKDLPGKPDIVFRRRKKVILVHGCFWHQHSACREGRLPGTQQEYWIPKLGRNVERDKAHFENLKSAGWQALVIWECETLDLDTLEFRLRAFLD
jgi:DNA mismatch endonuclease (patch repair protein)